jgi:hypothetical protein
METPQLRADDQDYSQSSARPNLKRHKVRFQCVSASPFGYKRTKAVHENYDEIVS